MPFTMSHAASLPAKAVKNEPVISAAAVTAIVSLLAAFGLDLTAEQVAALATVILTILVPLVRHFVTPTAKQLPQHRG